MTTPETSPRIEPLSPPYPLEVQASFDVVMRGAPPLLLFRTVAQNPRVLQRMMAGGLLDRGSLSLRHRELMILRTTARCGAEYEWGVHVAAFNAKAGFTSMQLSATVTGAADEGVWPDDGDRLVLQLADALHEHHQVEDGLWAQLAAVLAPDQLIELTMLAGLYHAVSYLVNTTRVALEPLAPRFPPA